MAFKLSIKTDNDAFEDEPGLEIARTASLEYDPELRAMDISMASQAMDTWNKRDSALYNSESWNPSHDHIPVNEGEDSAWGVESVLAAGNLIVAKRLGLLDMEELP